MAHSGRGPGLLGWLRLAAATKRIQERQVRGQNLRKGLLGGGHSAMLSWSFCRTVTVVLMMEETEGCPSPWQWRPRQGSRDTLLGVVGLLLKDTPRFTHRVFTLQNVSPGAKPAFPVIPHTEWKQVCLRPKSLCPGWCQTVSHPAAESCWLRAPTGR